MKRAVAAAMLCLLLSGCGRGGDSAASGGLLGRAAGLDESETLLVIDGREIPAWQYLYWLAADCQQLEARCEVAETPLDWAAPLPDGGTYGELVKADALADTALYATVQTWAETYGCTLTAEERAALPERTYPFLTAEQGRVLAETGQAYVKLYALYQKPDSPLAPAEGELELFQRESGFLPAERILIPSNGDRTAAQQQAAALFARLNAAADPSAEFDALLKETGGGVLADEDWTDDLRDAASALEPGQISGLLETEEGVSILRRLPADSAAVKEAYFDQQLQDAAGHSEIQWTDACAALNPETFWNAVKRGESID